MKVKTFEDKYKTFLEASSTGSLSKVQSATRQSELQAEQQTLATEEQQIQFRILQKREVLLKPILSDIDALIQSVGKEANYTMIFDTSVAGALLFAVETEDLTELLKSRCTPKQ